MIYRLFLDDIRNPPDEDWIVCRSTQEAVDIIKERGIPDFMSLDHDLGGEDTTMVFLKRLVNEIWDGQSTPPKYQVHSANPIGTQNIISYMESWIKSIGGK
jgi:hypothetical protein